MEDEGICRTCLKTTDKLMPLFQTPLLVFKIVAITSVEIFRDDSLPQTICEECCKKIDSFFNFKEMIISNDSVLKKKYIESARVLNENINIGKNVDNFVELVNIKSEIKDQNSIEDYTLNALERVDNTTVNNTDCWDVLPKRENNSFEATSATDTTIICDLCGDHIRGISLERHKNLYCINPVNCEKCGTTLKNRRFLATHLRIVHGEDSYYCKKCNRGFSVYRDFQRHIGRCNPEATSKQRKYAGQKSKNSNQKTASSKSAHASSTHNCDVCRMSCNSRKLLRKHMQARHGVELKQVCKYCSEALPNRKSFKAHMLSHSSYACPHCARRFVIREGLRSHIKLKHCW